MRGNATSRAPSCKGRTKLPSEAGMPGMMKKKIIKTPCTVKNAL